MCLTKWQAASSHDGAQVVWLGRGGRCWVLLPQAEELAVGVQLDAGLLHGLQSKGQLLQTGAKTVAAMQSESAQKWQSTLPHSQRMAGHRTSLQCPAIGKPLKGKYAFTLRPPTLVGGLQDDIANHNSEGDVHDQAGAAVQTSHSRAAATLVAGPHTVPASNQRWLCMPQREAAPCKPLPQMPSRAQTVNAHAGCSQIRPTWIEAESAVPQ